MTRAVSPKEMRRTDQLVSALQEAFALKQPDDKRLTLLERLGGLPKEREASLRPSVGAGPIEQTQA